MGHAAAPSDDPQANCHRVGHTHSQPSSHSYRQPADAHFHADPFCHGHGHPGGNSDPYPVAHRGTAHTDANLNNHRSGTHTDAGANLNGHYQEAPGAVYAVVRHGDRR